MIGGMVKDVEAELRLSTNDVDQAMAIQYMMPTGFTPTEIADYIDFRSDGDADTDDGMTPERTTGVPKLTLEFTNPELRDAFKAFCGEVKREGVPSGDVLADRLGVKVVKKRGKKAKS
jgi:hypothetical protein